MTQPGWTAALALLSACSGPRDDTGDTGDVAWALSIPGQARAVEDTERPVDLRVAAVQVRFGVVFGEDLSADGAVGWGTVDADGRFVLGLPEAPDADTLGPLSKRHDETLRGALYWVVVYQDVDGDGFFDVDEDHDGDGVLDPGEDHDGDGVLSTAVDRVMGADMDRWLVYLDQAESPDEPELTAGWPLGWSLVDLALSGQYEPNRCLYDTTEPLLWMTGLGLAPAFFPLDEGFDVPLAGLSASLTLEGEVSGAGEGVVGLPYQLLDAEEPLDKVFDASVSGGRFQGTLSEAPPASHDINGDPDWRYTYAILLPYTHFDDDGVYTALDDVENATVCADDQRVYLRYTRPLTRYRGYRFLECYGATVGWRLATTDPESGAPVFWSSAQSLHADLDPETCPLW